MIMKKKPDEYVKGVCQKKLAFLADASAMWEGIWPPPPPQKNASFLKIKKKA